MNSFLKCEGLRKSFDGTPVLKDIDLTLGQGQCLVLLGPSGCGKTTLLNIMSGMLRADAGRFSCDGETLDDAAKGIHIGMRQRNFSMVFQDFSLWPHMTVEENVAFGLKIKGVHRADREARVRRAIEQVQMEAFMKRKPSNLSGGQQQRVAIARALVVRPRLILLDEPLSALDARLREDLKTEIGTLLRETGLTAVYVTHDQSEAFTLGDKVALMYEGRIEQMDRPEILYAEPATRFAAGFIGTSNILDYQHIEGSLRFDCGLQLTVKNEGIPQNGHMVVRREAVRIWPNEEKRDTNGDIRLVGKCARESFLGDRNEVEVSLETGLRLRGFSDKRIASGHPVHIAIAPQALRFLEK